MLRTGFFSPPGIPLFLGAHLVAIFQVGPKFSHHKARVLAVGSKSFGLGKMGH